MQVNASKKWGVDRDFAPLYDGSRGSAPRFAPLRDRDDAGSTTPFRRSRDVEYAPRATSESEAANMLPDVVSGGAVACLGRDLPGEK